MARNPWIMKLLKKREARMVIPFKLDLDYNISADDQKSKIAPRQITDYVFTNSLTDKYKDGSKDATVRKTGARITNALRRALQSEQDSVDFELHQVEFLQDALTEWAGKAPFQWWSYIETLREHISDTLALERAKLDEAKSAAKASAP